MSAAMRYWDDEPDVLKKVIMAKAMQPQKPVSAKESGVTLHQWTSSGVSEGAVMLAESSASRWKTRT